MAFAQQAILIKISKLSPAEIEDKVVFDSSLVAAIAELAFNVIYNKHIKLTADDKIELKKHKANLDALANKSVSIAKKQRVLTTRGHKILPVLLQTALPFILSSVPPPDEPVVDDYTPISSTPIQDNIEEKKRRRRCSYCERKSDRKTSLSCKQCDIPICYDHVYCKSCQ